MTDQEKFYQREIKHREEKIEELKKALKIILTQCQGGRDFTLAIEAQAMQALKQAK